MKSSLVHFASLSCMLLLAACTEKAKENKIPSHTEAIEVNIVPINSATANGTVEGTGQFTTDDETFLAFKTGGYIQKILVKEGDHIRKGQVLATLDLTEIQAQVKQAELALEKAKRDFARVSNLYKDSVATLEQFQNAKTGLDITQQQVQVALFNLNSSEVRASSDGVVMKKLAQPGQLIGPGMPVLVISSKGESDWVLRIAVSDKEWMSVNLGDTASVSSDIFDGKTLKGFVSKKSESSDQYTGLFAIDVQLSNSRSLNLAAGMFGKAKIGTKRLAQSYPIPYEALLDANQNKGFVFVTNDKLTASKVEVEIASLEKDKVLLSKGLEGYSYLITAGSAYLKDSSKISVRTQ